MSQRSQGHDTGAQITADLSSWELMDSGLTARETAWDSLFIWDSHVAWSVFGAFSSSVLFKSHSVSYAKENFNTLI